MVEVLIKASDRRGGDSWGVVCPTSGNRYELYKGLGDISKNKIAGSLSAFDTLYGHTRKATTGTVSLANAHPFQVNHIVGAHNGTIGNASTMNAKYNRHCTVDSQHIFRHLSENKPLDELVGWGAIWWFCRSRPHALSLFKESEYNLAAYGIGVHGKDVRGVVFASNGRDIEDALDALGRPHFEYQLHANLEYQISTWEQLTVTDHKMQFRSWHSDNGPVRTFYPLRSVISYCHVSRNARSQLFRSQSRQCCRCDFSYLTTYDIPGIGDVCADCFEPVQQQQIKVHTDA